MTDLFPGVPIEQIPAKPDHVYADSMAFGMGMNCLQVRRLIHPLPLSSFPACSVLMW